MIGRCVAVALRLPVHCRLSRGLSQCCSKSSSHSSSISVVRLYTTAQAPGKLTGELSEPVGDAPSSKKPRSAPGSSKSQRAGSQKKKKKSGSKVRPPGRTKKVLTPRQQELRERRAKELELSEMKRAALKPPQKFASQNAWRMFTSEKYGRLSTAGEQTTESERNERFIQRIRDMSEQWRHIDASELERYKRLANAENERILIEYKRWVESHSPEEIRLANNARKKLNKLHPVKKGYRLKWPAIEDERRAKRPLTSYLQYQLERLRSGDFDSVKFRDRAGLIAQEWKALAESEKQKYSSLAVENAARAVPVSSSSSSAAAAAAAA